MHMPAPIGLTVPAVVDVALHGHSSVTFTMPVKDAGTLPLVVTAHTAELSAAAFAHPLPAGWLITVTPASFVIRPGHTRLVKVHVSGASGQLAVTDVVFTGAPAKHSGQARLAAGVASKVTFSNSGAVTAVVKPPPPAPAGPSPLAIGSGLLAAAMVITAAGVGIRRHYRGRQAASRHRQVPRHRPSRNGLPVEDYEKPPDPAWTE
jgi:hypothetical protein